MKTPALHITTFAKATAVVMNALLICSPALARIGETKKEIADRYGEPLSSNPDPVLPARAYKYQGFSIYVTFENGRSSSEMYEKAGRMTMEEVDGLLAANAGPFKWRKNADHDSANTFFAFHTVEKPGRVATFEPLKNQLMIADSGFFDRLHARQSAADRKKMKGF